MERVSGRSNKSELHILDVTGYFSAHHLLESSILDSLAYSSTMISVGGERYRLRLKR
jgi:hypothetical protein